MNRRTFITALTAFAGSLALGDFHLTRAFPFVQRRTVPQVVGIVTAVGNCTLTIPVPEARKGDLLVATLASYDPRGVPIEPLEIPEWTLISSQEHGDYSQQAWHKTAERDIRGDESLTLAVNGKHSVGQVYVFRGVEMEPRTIELYPDSIDIETIGYHHRK